MWNNKKVAVVIPAYNESERIEETLLTIPDWVDFIIPVDDQSTDDTFKKMQSISNTNPKIQIIQNHVNQGNGGSIVAGYTKALELSADILCVMDGDGQMDPAELNRLVEPVSIGKADMSKGNRFYSLTSFRGMPLFRLFGNLTLTFLNKIASGYWKIRDPQNGFVAVNSKLIKSLPLEKLAKGYNFQNDFLIWAKINKANILDIPIKARYRGESSKLNIYGSSKLITKSLWNGYKLRKTLESSEQLKI